MPTVLETLREGRPKLVTLKAAQEEIGWLFDRAEVVFKAAEAAGRELAADEAEIVEACQAEALRIKSEVIPRFEAQERLRNTVKPGDTQAEPYRIQMAGGQKPTFEFASKQAPKGFDTAEQAYRAGMGLFAGSLRRAVTEDTHQKATSYCREHGIFNTLQETNPAKGGAFVPNEFSSAVIRLVEEYGVFRNNARKVPMSRETLTVPKANGRLTTYFVSEGNAPTASDMTSEPLTLTARKLSSLTYVSNELTADAAISVAGLLAQEIGYAFALKEDQCGFLGDGTSTYGGIVGVTNAVDATYSTETAATGHDTWPELDMDDFLEVVAALPKFPGIQPKWYIHSAGYHQAMGRLMAAAGGNTWQMIQDGVWTPQFLGFPVVFTQVLTETLAAASVACVFGDLGLGAYFGDRQMLTVKESEHYRFINSELTVLAEERFDINIVSRINDAGNGAGALVVMKSP